MTAPSVSDSELETRVKKGITHEGLQLTCNYYPCGEAMVCNQRLILSSMFVLFQPLKGYLRICILLQMNHH